MELQFLFLIRGGEYTFPINKKRSLRTVQFRRKDVVFYKGARNIGHVEGMETLLTLDGVTLRVFWVLNAIRCGQPKKGAYAELSVFPIIFPKCLILPPPYCLLQSILSDVSD